LRTRSGDGGELLASERATRAAILGHLDDLKGCSEDDFAVIAFSGHGSELHQLMTYDADITSLAVAQGAAGIVADRQAEVAKRAYLKGVVVDLTSAPKAS
jgi:hypothetical protein